MMGPSSMRCSRLAVVTVAMLLAFGVAAVAQGPTFKLGRTPTEQELRPADAAIGPDGQGLPPGSGAAKAGATIYIARGCAKCHGPTGSEGPGPRLLGPPGGNTNLGIASNPFAPLIWSYINQMMPLDQQHQHVSLRSFSSSVWAARPTPCCLSPDEVYSLTAYLLYLGGIIQEGDVMDADSLPQVRMPNRDAYAPPPFLDSEWKPGLRQAQVK